MGFSGISTTELSFLKPLLPPCHCNIVLTFSPSFPLIFWATVMIFFVRVVLFLEHDPDTNLVRVVLFLDSLNINFQC